MYGEALLKNKERFLNPVDISTGELEKSMERALLRLEKDAHQFGDKMVQATEGILSTNARGHSFNRYLATDKVTWKTGIWTGLYHLAYLYSGDDTFLKVAKSHLKHYIEASKHPELHNDHDTGFKFTPSCVAAYKITGDEEAREAALRAAKILLDHCCPVNKFVIRIGTSENKNPETDCLLGYVTNSRPHCQVIENCEPFGDYFFFEALVRKLKPDFELFC